MFQSIKANEIDAYLDANPSAKIGNWPLEIGGEKTILPYYKIPIRLLLYNADNGRLAMEVREWQEGNNRNLDATVESDAQVIKDMLLGLDKTQTELLRSDLESKGQMEPGVITFDGIVINGNRRMALFETLHEKMPTGKWEYLEVVRLDSHVSQKDLWKLEAGLQLSKDKKAEYHPVNELLKIYQGIQAGLSPKEISASMYGKTEQEIDDALERLDLIDTFLEFMKQSKNYGLIKKFGYHEYFIDIQQSLITPWKRKGFPKKEIQTNLKYIYALLRANIKLQKDQQKGTKQKGITHWDIRFLPKIFNNFNAKATFTENINKAGKKEADLLSVPPDVIIEDFRSAREVITNLEDRDKPIVLIDRAIKALQSIDLESKHINIENVKDKLSQLKVIIDKIDEHLEKGTIDQGVSNGKNILHK